MSQFIQTLPTGSLPISLSLKVVTLIFLSFILISNFFFNTTIQAKIGGQYKFVDLLIIDSLVSLDIVLSICEVSANLTNAFTPKICSENFTSIRNTAKIELRHRFSLNRHP